MIPALLITLAASKKDAALQPPLRGDRKILVTEIAERFRDKEEVASTVAWQPPTSSSKCQVLPMRDTEFAVFTERAKQTCHCHMIGTEIYTLIEGAMTIEVEGTAYPLAPGDMIVVRPGAFHEVKRDTTFLCHVLTVNCGGESDRYEK